MPGKTDIELIAETINPERSLNWLWDYGTGKVPRIDSTNILRVIFRWAKYQPWWFVERGEADTPCSNIETMFSDLCTEWPDLNESEFVDYSVRIIAGAIRESKVKI